MKIIVCAIGSRGDVQPYLNLCQGLQEAGHAVTLATNPTLCSLAEAHGVNVAPVGPPIDMGVEGARLLAKSFNNMWIGMIRVMQLGARLVEDSFPDVMAVIRSADLVVTTDTASGIAEAEKLGIPWISVTLQPGRIPVDRPAPALPARLVWGVLGRLFIAPTNRFRRRIGAPLVKDISDILSKRLILLPVSRLVAPPDPKWPAHARQTGYWFARSLENWSPPEDLLAFLKAGNPPVAVSLGVMSMSGEQARQSARIVLEAVAAWGAAVVQGGRRPAEVEISRRSTTPGRCLTMAVWPGSAVSTTAFRHDPACCGRARGRGHPHVIDQFYWGQRVAELGAGPQFISRGKLTAAKLQAVLRPALEDSGLRLKAAALGEAIRAEPDGVREAVRMIESYGPSVGTVVGTGAG
jgi:sterol 3beta-glucosyltransferase